MLVVQVQGDEESEERRERGAERQVGQSRRRRAGRDEGGGGLDVQFFGQDVKVSLCGAWGPGT